MSYAFYDYNTNGNHVLKLHLKKKKNNEIIHLADFKMELSLSRLVENNFGLKWGTRRRQLVIIKEYCKTQKIANYTRKL